MANNSENEDKPEDYVLVSIRTMIVIGSLRRSSTWSHQDLLPGWQRNGNR